MVPDSALIGIKIYTPFSRSGISEIGRSNVPKIYRLRASDFGREIVWDSVSTYKFQETISGTKVLEPIYFNFTGYSAEQKEIQRKELSQILIQEGRQQEEQGKGLLDFSLKIPGGENSAFTTIFGKPEVNLRVNGSANMNVGASIQNVKDNNIPKDQQKRVDPTFNQNLQLNIQGTIGDKLTISTDWDTERTFDFQNRLKIAYTGYEDEIIKSIELGNVSMETGNSLVKGGGSLFGIKSVAELGALRITSVVSQQKGESKTQSITGGSQEIDFELRPSEYDDDQHFFLDFYNRQVFQSRMLDNLPNITTAFPNPVQEIHVWIEDATGATADEAVEGYAFVDLGVVENPDGSFALPDTSRDRIDGAKLETRRSNSSVRTDDLNLKGGVQPNSFYVELKEGEDYTFNRALGIISLKRRVGSNATLAVSFSYQDSDGSVKTIGDLVPPSGNAKAYFKLLRPRNLTPDDFAWELTMRNIYSLGVTNVTQEGLNFDLEINRDNQTNNRIPGSGNRLLEDLGLDLLDSEQAVGSDNQIDFDGLRFDPIAGKIMFPYLEPFGARIEALISELDTDQSELVFDTLYTSKKEIAFEDPRNRFYGIGGRSSGGVSSTFFLGGAGGLVEGSVKVFANGAELIEGVDYEIDYSFGTLTVLNDRFLAPGQNLRVEFENNQFFAIGQKNFTGVRAEYLLSDDISFGSTLFRLNEQTLSDKIRIGNEPINNTVIGFDADARFDTPWLTRFIDRIPLLQTRAESNFSISGEFAQLRPGVSQTNAVRDAIDSGILYEDEENGLSFIDDFEGSEFTVPLKFAARWNLPAAPAAIPGYLPDQDFYNSNDDGNVPLDIQSRLARSDLRAQFSWYEIPRNVTSIVRNASYSEESQPVSVRDVFSGRETNNPQEQIITTLDVYYDPTERGPYNYNMDLKNQLENNPEEMWGGMVSALPSGQQDLTQNNIEFLEFWVQTILPDGEEPTATDIQDYDGKMYIELGIISEDVVPNEVSNSEDGLAQNPESLERDNTGRSYVPGIATPPQGEFSNRNIELEDVGLDGVPNDNGFTSETTERALFADFLQAMEDAYGLNSPEYQQILSDPSNDDYLYFNDSRTDGLKLHERFHRVRGYYEGNTSISNQGTAATSKPDKEGLVTASNVELQNSYFQYEINYNPADFNNLEIGTDSTFIVDKVGSGAQNKVWRLVRIPLNEFTRKFGDINSFQNISYIRFWMSGYKKPFTARFATFEFVGSQWREEQSIEEARGSSADFKVATVNIEENAGREPIPYRQPEGSIREVNRGAQIQSLSNEQSLVLSAEGLESEKIKMVKRVYPGGLNLLNYSNIRMFVHGEGYDEREDAELVVRLGTDLNNDFYEYRQPITPSDPNFNFGDFDPQKGGRLNTEAEEIWKYDENSMNIIISAFNVLKQARNNEGISSGELYERADLLGGGTVTGAVLAIKGNPSLDQVSEIGLGIKNPHDPDDINSQGNPVLDAELWVNELRISGFDNENGWAANAKATLKMADFATMNANVTRQTTGFGGLDSRLGQRSVSDQLGYSVSSTVNLHKLIPDRYGWSFPVTVSARRSTSTPKFLPDQGDITLDDFIAAEESRSDISNSEIDENINQKINDIQTVSEGYSLNVSNISKRNSKGKLAQYTLDKTKLSYVYNEGYSKNPQLEDQNNWNYTAGINYSLSFPRVRLFRPFKFTESLPGLNILSGLRVGYMPSSISASTSATRSYDERRRKILGNPEVQPIQQTHSFTQKSNFGFNYNFTPSITTSFRSNTNFDLSTIGIEDGNFSGPDSLRYNVRPTFQVFEDIITVDSISARRSSYSESYTANWRPKLNQIKALNWLTYNASYTGGFQWNNSPRGSNLGARVTNRFELNNTIKFNTEKIIDGIGFVERMRNEDDEESKERSSGNNAKADTTKGLNFNPIKDAKFIGRKLVLALFSMRNVDLNYKKSRSSAQQGYQGESQIFYAFGGTDSFSPPIGYRTGLYDEIPISELVRNESNPLAINKNYSDNLTLGTQLQLFKSISIDLDWSTRWDERNTETLNFSGNNGLNRINVSSGEINSSVWAFGVGYEDFFRSQLRTAFQDLNNGTIDDANGNNDGRTLLNRVTLQDDFRAAYLSGNVSGIGQKEFTPIPKPNWRVTWQGFEKIIPIIGERMNRASLSHSYKGTYRLGWNFVPQFGEETSNTLAGIQINDIRDRFEPASITVDQRFSPLIQLNITWKSALKTDFGLESSKLTTFSLSSKTVSERKSRGVKVNLNYTFRRVNIPIFPNIKNNIDLSLSGNFSEDTDRSFILENDLIRAFNNFETNGTNVNAYEFDAQNETGQIRYNASLVIGYRISSSINSNFEYTFNRVTPKGSSIPPRTNQEIRFNIRIAIRSR